MKLVDMTCPHCGAPLKINPGDKHVICDHCGANLYIDDNQTIHINYDAEKAGYDFERGRQRAEDERINKLTNSIPSNNYQSSNFYVPHASQTHPQSKSQTGIETSKGKRAVRLFLILVAIMVVWSIVTVSKKSPNQKEAALATAEPDMPDIAEEYGDELGISTPNASDAETINSIDDNSIHITSTSNQNDHYDESLKGRGWSESDSKLSPKAPDYVNVIGYVALDSEQAFDLESQKSFPDESQWTVPTYTQDKQYWNVTGSLPHKTKVVVREEILENSNNALYSGYLQVERTDTHEKYYIDVSDFVTRPYWNNSNILEALSEDGAVLIAEYHQTSDYYPNDGSGNKLDIPDGTTLLVTGPTTRITSDNNINPQQTDIAALVWKQWTYGYGSAYCYFNHADLKIVS